MEKTHKIFLFFVVFIILFGLLMCTCKNTLIEHLKEKDANVTILIRGESFRSGGQNSREVCQSNECIKNQIECFMSIHEFVIEPLEKIGFKCRVHMHTYYTPFIDVFLKYFANVDVSYRFENKGNETQSSMWKKSIEYCIKNFNQDYLLVIRPDMMFHSHFVHDIQFNKFNHGFRIGNHFGFIDSHLTPKKRTRISDTLQWIPKYYFNIANIFPSHEYYDILPYMEKESVYISKMYSDTDSSKCQNPIYLLSNRKISKLGSSTHI